MTINEYQQETLRTALGMNYKSHGMCINAVLGLCGELSEVAELTEGTSTESSTFEAMKKAGRICDMVKKSEFQGHELDKQHIAEELGDVAWYLAVSAHAIGYPLETIMQMNVDKLMQRYPDGFDPDKSVNRGR